MKNPVSGSTENLLSLVITLNSSYDKPNKLVSNFKKSLPESAEDFFDRLLSTTSFSTNNIISPIAVIANAIIDRLVHHCEIIKIAGRSYRVKDRKIFEDEPESTIQISSY